MSDSRYYTPDPRDPRRPGQGSEAGQPRPGRRAARPPAYEEQPPPTGYRPRPKRAAERPAPRPSGAYPAIEPPSRATGSYPAAEPPAQTSGSYPPVEPAPRTTGSYPAAEPAAYEPPPGYPEPAYQPGKRAARGKRAAYPASEETAVYPAAETYAEERYPEERRPREHRAPEHYPEEPAYHDDGYPPEPAADGYAEAYEEPYEEPPPPPRRPPRPAFFEEDDRPLRRRGRYDDEYGDYDDDYDEPRRRFGLKGCLAVLIALLVIGGGLAVGGVVGFGKLKDMLAPPADYPGPGSGSVTFQVHQGDNGAVQGRNLKALGVVKSVDAYIAAANKNPKASGIQVGYYALKTHMKAADVVAYLSDPKHLVTNAVTVVEGSRAKAIYQLMSSKTKIPVADFKQAAADPTAIGLPAYAKGNVEGYLFPATYLLPPKVTAQQVLKMMVDRWKQAVADNDVVAQSQKLGFTPEQVMTVASLVQAEGRGSDMPKVSRVIYNRVLHPGTEGTTGRLQIDASVNYALGQSGTTALTSQDLQVRSPYNLYTHKGLPPGPIGSPGDDAIKAALNPTPGDWYYYVTVNLKTGETKFAKTPAEFEQFKAQYKQYCATQSASC